jgi:5'-3' exonuclease
VTRTLLLDADLLAYRASSANQRSYDWNGDGNRSVAADEDAARVVVENEVERLADRLAADHVIICLSDDFNSFRKDRVDPTYKALRSSVERPVHLYDIKAWMEDTYDSLRWNTLEADDVMGIMATDPTRDDERIIVSADKDMMTIPGKLYRPQEQTGNKPVVRDISLEEADRFHLWQTIVGDVTDGYPGLPGDGPHAADKILDWLMWRREERELQRGPRKGEIVSEWVYYTDPPYHGSRWERVVAAFARRGLTEDDALKQARLARILRYGEYDGRTPRLWLPPSE